MENLQLGALSERGGGRSLLSQRNLEPPQSLWWGFCTWESQSGCVVTAARCGHQGPRQSEGSAAPVFQTPAVRSVSQCQGHLGLAAHPACKACAGAFCVVLFLRTDWSYRGFSSFGASGRHRTRSSMCARSPS